MRVKKGYKVKVIKGKDKGKVGTVLKVLNTKDKVLVEGINIVKRHVKPGVVSKEGGIIKLERPIAVSNVIYMDEKSGEPSRIGFKNVDDKKYRLNKNSGEVLEK